MPWQRFVAMGDSLTEGWGDWYPGLSLLSWADRLAAALESLHPEFQYANVAYRGLTSAQILDQQLNKVLALQPDLAALTAGGNDLILSNWDGNAYRKNMETIISELHNAGATVITITYPNFPEIFGEEVAPYFIEAEPLIKEMNSTLRKLTARYDGVLLDAWQHPMTHLLDGWSADRVHPNSLGYLRMARAAAELLGQRASIDMTEIENLTLPEGIAE